MWRLWLVVLVLWSAAAPAVALRSVPWPRILTRIGSVGGIGSRILTPDGATTCEVVVKSILRQGISSGGFDVLERARELDRRKEQRALLGLPVFVSPSMEDFALRDRLVEGGALVFEKSNYSGASNPRDPSFAISFKSLSDSADASVTAAAVESVVRGSVAAAVLPASKTDALFPDAIALSGIVGLRRGDVILCGNSLEDVNSLGAYVFPDAAPPSVKFVPKNASLPLSGIRVLHSVQALGAYGSAPLEESVRISMELVCDTLKMLGAEITRFKGKVPAVEGQFDVLLSPALPTAAQPLVATAAAAAAAAATVVSSAAGSPSLSADMGWNNAVTIPVGTVCGDDSGYDPELNEERFREGLPINCYLVPLNPTSISPMLECALRYERWSRWSSEVFRASATREQAQEDLEDAREAFGFYFRRSLLTYFAKRR